MKTVLFIANKYFFKGSVNSFVHIVSVISLIGMALGAFTLIVALSFFNGMRSMVEQVNTAFDTDFVVVYKPAKYFALHNVSHQIGKIDGIKNTSACLDENVLIGYGQNRTAVKMLAVDTNFNRVTNIEDFLLAGDFVLNENEVDYAVYGAGIHQTLGLVSTSDIRALEVWYPSGNAPRLLLNPLQAFKTGILIPSGIFSVEKKYDENYLITNLSFAQQLTQKEGQISELRIDIEPTMDEEKVKNEIAEILGPDFEVRNRQEQHPELYKVLKIEKFFVTLILIVILIIASFNVFFSVTMLSVEKREEFRIMYLMGLKPIKFIELFMVQSWFNGVSGGTLGLLVGLIFCYLQTTFGIIETGITNATMYYLPVKVYLTDVLLVFGVLVVINVVVGFLPAFKLTQSFAKNQ